jgi:signal transduction histidine kinase
MKSPAMFTAELTTVFSNLLTNAVKAAGENGRIRATGQSQPDGSTKIIIENTGVQVDLGEGERWFKPFESTTTALDPVLGQGMGLGLPITRNMLEQYGAEIKFVRPSRAFSTAVEITFPG